MTFRVTFRVVNNDSDNITLFTRMAFEFDFL